MPTPSNPNWKSEMCPFHRRICVRQQTIEYKPTRSTSVSSSHVRSLSFRFGRLTQFSTFSFVRPFTVPRICATWVCVCVSVGAMSGCVCECVSVWKFYFIFHFPVSSYLPYARCRASPTKCSDAAKAIFGRI